MTPVRALLASLFAAILLAAGAFIAASLAGGRPHDLTPLLALDRTPFSLWCFLAAWGAVGLGGLAILAAFLAFIAPEEEDDPRFRRRGFPKGAPILLIALALGLVWVALRCAGDTPVPPISAPVAPDPSVPAPSELLGETTETPQSAPPPAPETATASYQWPYKAPLARDGADLSEIAERPLPDENENRLLLCGKIWAAVTGSASEEGPTDRNRRRALLRARAAQRAADAWIEGRPECGPTIVFGVNLGQHARASGDGGDGASTGYQRQVLVVARARAGAAETLTPAAAEAELRAFLADPAGRAALYGGRVFPDEPQILAPYP